MTQSEVKKAFHDYLPAKRAYEVARRSAKKAHTDRDGLREIIDSDIADSDAGKAIAEATERYVACINNLSEKLLKYAEIMERAEKLLELADTQGATIIRLRWMEGVHFDFIPAMIYCDIRTMYRSYEKALKAISEKS